jgi:hypothetical protein
MTPTREQNWCCGGLMALDNEESRIKTGMAKKDRWGKIGSGRG